MDREPATDLPRRCGRYVLIDSLGGGGMAEVYKARKAESEGPDRILVVKLLPPDADPTAAARFIDEAKIALPLTHGNITTTFEFGRAEERPFLVMEYVHGKSLRQLIDALAEKGETASVTTSLFIAREIARALGYAHRFVDDAGKLKPVIHRDVSPENVLVSFAGQVKLTDFGIARSAEALDLTGAWGKPAYVAPEILGGDPGGPPSDLYSLGCVLYEMLSGWPPLIGKSDDETLTLVREQSPVPLKHLRDDVPESLSDLLEQVLEKTPAIRGLDTPRFEVMLSQQLATASPHFTEADLAATLSRLLGPRASGDTHQEAVLASRLRDQLSDAGVETSGRESAAEMLALGTVQLSPEPDDPFHDPYIMGFDKDPADTTLKVITAKPTDKKNRWMTPVIAIIALSVILGIASLFLFPGLFGTTDGNTGDGGAVAHQQDDASIAPNEQTDAAPGTAPDRGPPPAKTPGGDAAPTNVDGSAGDGGSTKTQRPRRRRPAIVTFNSHPWSFVYVDGRKLPGHTPVRNVFIPAGRHRIRFVNPELGLSKSRSIHVAPGEKRFVKVRLAKAGGAG